MKHKKNIEIVLCKMLDPHKIVWLFIGALVNTRGQVSLDWPEYLWIMIPFCAIVLLLLVIAAIYDIKDKEKGIKERHLVSLWHLIGYIISAFVLLLCNDVRFPHLLIIYGVLAFSAFLSQFIFLLYKQNKSKQNDANMD